MCKYIKRWEENLKIYNKEHNTNYTFKDIQQKFIDAGEVDHIEDKCMCGQSIIKNFIIENSETNDSMIVGSVCIKKYIPNAQTKCKGCKIKFKFDGNNRCKKCRRKISVKCNECNEIFKIRRYKTKKFIKCKKCIEEEKNKCKKCNKKIDGDKYKYCYICNMDIKKQKLKKRII
jgi:hypothetical protein